MAGVDEQIKHTVDAVSAGVVVGALVDWLPPMAAAFTIVWTGIRIYETKTAQRLCRRIRYGRKKE
jgi:hypothetical protein